MATWYFKDDYISPMEVRAFMKGARDLFSRGRFPYQVRSIRRSGDGEQGGILRIELESPAELINDDDLVLDVLEEIELSLSQIGAQS